MSDAVAKLSLTPNDLASARRTLATEISGLTALIRITG